MWLVRCLWRSIDPTNPEANYYYTLYPVILSSCITGIQLVIETDTSSLDTLVLSAVISFAHCWIAGKRSGDLADNHVLMLNILQ